MNKLLLSLSLALAACAPAMARDDTLHLSFQEMIDVATAQGKLDGSVKFYLEGAPTPKVLQKLGSDQSNKKTNSVGKSPEQACQWAGISALVAFQAKAQQMGANAVVGMVSFYKSVEFKSATEYECHDGNIMSGVALKGHYVKVAGK